MPDVGKKIYLPVKNKENFKNVTHLMCECYYDLGGMNYFTSRVEQRGYYMSVSPVERTKRDGFVSESYMAFSGKKFLISPAKRKSQKAMENAIKKFDMVLPGFIESHFSEYEVDYE